MNQDISNLPDGGFLRISQIVGRRPVSAEEAERNRVEAKEARAAGKHAPDKPVRPREGLPGLLPMSESTWWLGIRTGRFPKPVRLSDRIVAWRTKEIRELIANPQKRWG